MKLFQIEHSGGEGVNWYPYESSKFKLIQMLVQLIQPSKFRGVNWYFP